MLIGIPPLLGPDFLATLRAIGHGDELAIVDGNYPALDHARRLVRADGHGVLAVVQAVLTVLPLDRAVPAALFRASGITGLHNATGLGGPAAYQEVLASLAAWQGFVGRNADVFCLVGTVAALDAEHYLASLPRDVVAKAIESETVLV